MLTSSSFRNAILAAGIDAGFDLFDAGSKFQLWSGSIPSAVESSPSGTMIAECAMSSTPFASESSGVVAANSITPDSDTDSGTATFCRVVTSANVCHIQLTAGTSGVEFILDNATFVATDTLTVSSLAFNVSVTP